MNEFPLRVFITRENFLIIYRINKNREKLIFHARRQKWKSGWEEMGEK